MKEYQLRQGLGKTVVFSFCVWASVAGLFSCDSDRLNGGGSVGKLSLNLAADTANIKGGSLSTKAGNVLADFEDVDNYTVQIYQESDTLKSALYKDFPDELEIKEGAYTLRASKGEKLPAAFDNPYFEGSTDFVIKKDMKTPLEVTCTMANARVYAEYSEDFLKAYSDYSVSLKTPFMDNVFTITKGETRGAYLQVEKEGTPLSVAISLMRENWKEPKVYTVTDPTITLNPKESVRLKFATDGKTGDGLDLSIVLDDEMIETELVDSIPDFMWKPFEKPTLEAHGFVSGQTMQLTKGSVKEAYIAFGIPAGIGGFSVYETVKGSTDTVKYDLAIEENISDLKKKGYDISVPAKSLLNYSGSGQLLLDKMLNQLECSETGKPYEFIFFAKDNLPNTNYTDTVRLFAEVYPTAPTIQFEGDFGSVIEGEAMKQDVTASIEAEGKIKDVVVTISTDAGKKEYHYSASAEWEQLGATLSKSNDDTKATLTFPKTFTERLDALEDGDQTYTITAKVETEIGLEGKTSVEAVKIFTVKYPWVDITMTEGDAYAKRAFLRGKITGGKVENITFQYKLASANDNSWTDVKETDTKDQEQVATATNLTPGSEYVVRAVYHIGEKARIGKESTFTTETAFQIPDGGFDQEWTKDVISAVDLNFGGIGSGLVSGKDIDIWYSFTNNKKEDAFWSTSNIETTDASTEHGTADYIQYSGVRRVNGAAELTTVAWGYESTMIWTYEKVGGTFLKPIFDWVCGGIIKKVTPGALFTASYVNGEFVEGFPISARPMKLKFKYKYKPYKSDNFVVSVILENNDEGIIVEAKKSVSESKDSFTSYVLDFSSYVNDNTKNKIKADRIRIRFESGMNNSDDAVYGVKGSAGALSGYNDSKRIGSVLTIDNVELIYE